MKKHPKDVDVRLRRENIDASLRQSDSKLSAVPTKAWERHYDLCGTSENMKLTSGSDFIAKSPASRKTTYVKVNDTDT